MRLLYWHGRSVAVRRSVPAGVVTLVALALAAAGCGDTAAPGGGGTLEKTTLSVGMVPVVDNAQLKVAIDQGFFTAEGLKVKPVSLTGGTEAVDKLKSGQLDAAFSGYVSFFEAQSDGKADLRIVADASQCGDDVATILVPIDSPVRQLRDLVGKKIAVNAPRGVVQLLAEASFAARGILGQGQSYPVVAFPEMGAALKGKKIDAIATSEPYTTALQQTLGARVIADVCEGSMADFPLTGFAATADFAKRNPKTVEAFRRAIVKAQKLLSDRTVAEQAITSYTQVDATSVKVLNLPAYPISLSAIRLQRVSLVMQQQGYLKQELDVERMIVND